MNKILHLYGKSVCSVLRPQKSLMQSNDLPASLTLDYYDICYVVCVERARAAKGSSMNYVPATKLICILLMLYLSLFFTANDYRQTTDKLIFKHVISTLR